LAHFSKYIRPGAVRIGFENPDESLMMTAAQNSDGSIALVILNMDSEVKNISLSLDGRSVDVQISAQAIQTIVISE
jgi:glucosylceramidase